MKDKIRGLFLGVALGDKLGSPFESRTYEEVKKMNKDVKGHTTDDWQLTKATANSLIKCGNVDMVSIGKHHVDALKETTRGWGSTTREAITKISNGGSWKESGNFNGQANRGFGNGIPMKVGPLAAWCALSINNPNPDVYNIHQILLDFTSMTHQTSVAVSSCFAHVAALLFCLVEEEFTIKRFLNKVALRAEYGRRYYKETIKDDLADKIRVIIPLLDIPDLLYSNEYLIGGFGGGTCYVYNSLPFSYAFFARGPFNIETLYDVAYAGGDSDTNASLVGGLLGALNGTKIFPDKLINDLDNKDEVLEIADNLYNTFC